MKTTLVSLLLGTSLFGATVALADDSRATARATATVELIDPEQFTDFKSSRMGTAKDVQALARELRREVNRQAAKNLPAGYQVMLRIQDIGRTSSKKRGRRSAPKIHSTGLDQKLCV